LTEDCSPDKIIYDEERGEYICTETGEVIEERVIDLGTDWRAYTPKERVKRPRTGPPINQSIHDLGISSTIDWKDIDTRGTKLSARNRINAMKLRKWNLRTRLNSASDRNLYQAMQEIERIISLLNLPKVVKEESAIIYRKAFEKKLIRGRSIDEMVAASIYTACRRLKIIKSVDEIAKYSKAKRNDITKAYRLLFTKLDIEIPTVDPKDYVIGIADSLKISVQSIRLAMDIIEKAKKIGITDGKDPAGVAASALYVATVINNEPVTQHTIAKTAGITDVTLRNRYKELVTSLKLNIPSS